MNAVFSYYISLYIVFLHKNVRFNTLVMPRCGAMAYCNRAVCHSVCPSFTSISHRLLKTKRLN